MILGNLDAKRDWGYAPEYVESMWLMLQQPKADDYVIATGETNTVRHFCELAFLEVGIKISWTGQGVNERGINSGTGKEIIQVSEKYFRPTEVDILVGDSTKAKRTIGWEPKKNLQEIIKIMVAAEHENEF